MAGESASEVGARPSAERIYERVKQDARDELERAPFALGCSALLAGGTMGFSSLAMAAVEALLAGHGGARFVGALFYPLGFIVVILGRGQLFTENTLYPLTLVLDERRHVVRTLRLWAVVLAMNVVGAVLFAVLCATTAAIPPDATDHLVALGHDQAARALVTVFWSAVAAGWLLALVAWLVEATEVAVGQILAIWALTFLVGLLGFDHSVATTSEVFVSAIRGATSGGTAVLWLVVTTLGNVVGGAVIVALLNYGQVRGGSE